MELTGLNLLLIILLAPCIFIVVFMLLIAPLLKKNIDKGKPIENEIREEGKRFLTEIKEKKDKLFRRALTDDISEQEIKQFRKETSSSYKKYRGIQRNHFKKLRKTTREDTGLANIINEVKVTDGEGSALWYLGSLLFAPVFILLIKITSLFFNLPRRQPIIIAIVLLAPFLGLFFSFKGYKIYRKKSALILCLVINGIYFAVIYNVVMLLGKAQ